LWRRSARRRKRRAFPRHLVPDVFVAGPELRVSSEPPFGFHLSHPTSPGLHVDVHVLRWNGL